MGIVSGEKQNQPQKLHRSTTILLYEIINFLKNDITN
jgi:hypothetical protein